jgi:outer membrane protein TolC
MRKLTLILTSLILLLTISSPAAFAAGPPQRTIAILTDGPWLSDPQAVQLFQKEIVRNAEGSFTPVFPARFTIAGDNTAAGIEQQLEKLQNTPEVDLILTLGVIGSAIAVKNDHLRKPVIAPFILNADTLKAPLKEGGSGVYNLTYIDLKIPVDRAILAFQKITPISNIAILIDERDLKAIPSFKKFARNLANEYSFKVRVVPTRTSGVDTVAMIPEECDAVLIGPLWRLTALEFSHLTQALISRKLPSFSLWDRRDVVNGIMASDMPDDTLEQIARRTAITVQEVLGGEDAARLPVAFYRQGRTCINMATARAIDVYPSLAMMTGADLLNEKQTNIERQLTIQQAVDEALQANLDLISTRLKVEEGAHYVDEARSALLPQLFLETGARTVDSDRARAAGGMTPQHAWTGTAKGVQQIYSENSWAQFTAEKYRQNGRDMEFAKIKLDITEEAAIAYLNVLRAHNIEQIYKNNLKLTQENLDRARIRVNTGIAGPDELYRWQTQFAKDQQAVLYHESATFDSEEALNRILNRPLDEPFKLSETRLDDPLLIAGDQLFFNLIQNPRYFRTFRSLTLEKALEIRPELKAYDAAIAAQKRLHTASKRSFWLPDFTIEGGVDQIFTDNGTGERKESLSDVDRTDWSIGIYARFPLFEGGRKMATLKRTGAAVTRLHSEKTSAETYVRQEVLNAINNTRASYPSISLSREAAEAARRNLKLITNSYMEGIKSIIDLIDAQTQYLATSQTATNAVYDFLIDMMKLERAMGKFITFLPVEEKQQWNNEIREILKATHEIQ